ncbi:hypothetical protein ACJX0J_012118 [Zea mays]
MPNVYLLLKLPIFPDATQDDSHTLKMECVWVGTFSFSFQVHLLQATDDLSFSTTKHMFLHFFHLLKTLNITFMKEIIFKVDDHQILSNLDLQMDLNINNGESQEESENASTSSI